jgi:hypothetical protein
MDTDPPYPDTLAPNACELFADLCSQLPKAADDTEEAIAARARRAMDAVFALHQEDAFEARLATRIVAMDAHAADCLHAAAAADPWEGRRCRAQAASMARQSDSALRALRRMQSERDKALAGMHPAAMGRAGYWFKEASVPGQDCDPGPEPRPVQAAEAEPQRTQADVDADVRLYAAMYPERAARIRAARGLPSPLDFGPPEPDIIEGLVHGTSPILLALDGHPNATVSRQPIVPLPAE